MGNSWLYVLAVIILKPLRSSIGAAFTAAAYSPATCARWQLGALFSLFPRPDLLTETTKWIDRQERVDLALEASRGSRSGAERLDSAIQAWCNHISVLFGAAHALCAMRDTNKESACALDNRLEALRHGCEAALRAIEEDQRLRDGLDRKRATDLMMHLLSIHGWKYLVRDSNRPPEASTAPMQETFRKALLAS